MYPTNMWFNKNTFFAALIGLAATSEAAALHGRDNTTDACTQIYRTVNKAGKNQSRIPKNTSIHEILLIRNIQ